MEHNIGVGAIIGLVLTSSIYVWNNEKFSGVQKTILLICIVFPPAQWVGILIVLAYNTYKVNNSVEKIAESRVEQVKVNLENSISNLTDLKDKGILTIEEYKTKFAKINAEKDEQSLKKSLEYKQLKSLLDSGILTKEEFESKISLIKEPQIKKVSVEESDRLKEYVENIKLPTNEEPKNENSNNTFVYLFIVIAVILLSIFIISQYEENKVEQNHDSPASVAVDSSAYEEVNATYNYQEPIKNKKFVYVIVKTEIPFVTGYKSEYYDVKSYCSIEYKKQDLFSDIIEIEDYNEDVKYKLIDESESKILKDNQLLHHTLYSNAVVNYGYEAASFLKDNNYGIKIIESEVLTYDSYSEASKSKRNN